MNENVKQANASGCGRTIKRTLMEALLVVAAGSGFALAANALSPRGLKLTRDYFPTAVSRTAARPKAVEAARLPAVTASNATHLPDPTHLAVPNLMTSEAVSNLAVSNLVPLSATATANAPPTMAARNTFLAESPVVETNAKGLQIINRAQAVDFFRDARYQRGVFVCVDARREAAYREGHIPELISLILISRRNICPPCCRFARRRRR